MGTEKRKSFIIGFAYIAVIAVSAYLGIKYMLPLLLPFILGFAVSSLLAPIVRRISSRLSLSRRFVSFAAVLVFYATVGTLAAVLCIKLIVAAGRALGYLPTLYSQSIAPLLSAAFEKIGGIMSRLDDPAVGEYSELLKNVQLSFGSAISTFSTWALSRGAGIVADLPMVLIELILTLVSTFFFSADYECLTHALLSPFSPTTRARIVNVKKCTCTVLLKYVKSYCLIFLITFGELFLGLTVAGVERTCLTALLIAAFDILPVAGIGLVLIPWAIFAFLTKRMRLGVFLLVIYTVMTIVRNIIEPKIVGREVGLHPILTLIAMFVGTRLFGIVGLFGLPLGLSVVKAICDCGCSQ